MVSFAIELWCWRGEHRGAISRVTIIKAKGLFNCNDTTSFGFLLLKSASPLLFSHFLGIQVLDQSEEEDFVSETSRNADLLTRSVLEQAE